MSAANERLVVAVRRPALDVQVSTFHPSKFAQSGGFSPEALAEVAVKYLTVLKKLLPALKRFGVVGLPTPLWRGSGDRVGLTQVSASGRTQTLATDCNRPEAEVAIAKSQNAQNQIGR